MFVEMEHPTLGHMTVNGCTVKLGDTAPSVRTPAPALGQDNDAVLRQLGLSEGEIETLRTGGVI